jgi:3-deoxy-7-phosphoheptulonate synthase
MQIHQEMGTILGGVHLELTGEVNDDGFSVVRDSGSDSQRQKEKKV